MQHKKVAVSVLLPVELSEKIQVLAAASGRSRSADIRQILRRYIRYMEAKNDPDAGEID